MSRKKRELPPQLDRTIAGLRVAGMSERSIYERMRANLKTSPSYRDIRASFDRAALHTRHEATLARREGKFKASEVRRSSEKVHGSDYKSRLKVNVDPADREELNDAYLLGYLYRAGVRPEDISDASIQERLERIDAGEGSG